MYANISEILTLTLPLVRKRNLRTPTFSAYVMFVINPRPNLIQVYFLLPKKMKQIVDGPTTTLNFMFF